MEKVELSWGEIKEMFAETGRRMAEADRRIAEEHRLFAEFRRRFAEDERLRKEQAAEDERLRAESERIRKEQADESWRQMQQGFEDTRRLIAESDKKLAESERKYTGLNGRVEGIARSNGRFAEEYFLNTIEDSGLKFAGISFDEMHPHVKTFKNLPDGTRLDGEFDIVLTGAEAVAIIELKYKAESGDVEDIVDRKVKSFRALFPEYGGLSLYLGVGALSFDGPSVAKARKSGVALLKQVGQAVAYRSSWAARAY
ncbi:MAG: hypothetical protein LBH93_06655 [Chitinispirillales bacterium]|jgi:hypothetical protein|nr:hypothetical protein [Chitinispirillales bacterium]